MFFEIISPTGNKNYLLGTLHFNDKEIVSLPLEVKNAFDNASRVVIEADFTQTSTSLGCISEWMQHNHTEEYPPMFKSLIKIVNADQKRFENSFDMQLMDEAKRREKKLGFLETAEEQVRVVIGYAFDEFEQTIYYNWLNDNHGLDIENIKISFENLKKNYLANNLNAISENTLSLSAPEIAYKYTNSIFANRDIIQAEAMKPFMEEGNVFFAVGAGHLIGITNKLKAEGYTVNLIPLGKRIYSIANSKQALFNKPKVKEDGMQISPVIEQHSESKRCQNLDSTQKDPKNIPSDPHFRRPGLG
jgi:uncharacterized protein YbaP (TraB family)